MNKLEIHKKLIKFKKSIYKISDLKKIFNLRNDNSTYHAIKRLKKDSVLHSLRNGVYCFEGRYPDDFLIANNLYSPSYISLETALNYYGILIQTPHQIFSITPLKRKYIKCIGKEFIFCHISKDYFFDYIKEKDFLIATPEKALIDTILFNSVGKWITDFDELNYKGVINKKRLYKIKNKIKNKAFNKLFESLKL